MMAIRIGRNKKYAIMEIRNTIRSNRWKPEDSMFHIISAGIIVIIVPSSLVPIVRQ